MWGFAHRTAWALAACAVGLVFGNAAVVAQQKPQPQQPDAANKTPTPADICYGLTGAAAATKVSA